MNNKCLIHTIVIHLVVQLHMRWAGWSATLLFTSTKVGFSCDNALQEVTSSSLSGGTVLFSRERHFKISLVVVSPRKHPNMTEKLLTGTHQLEKTFSYSG